MKYSVKVNKRIIDYCKTNYTKIDKSEMILGNGLFNHRCHLNAVQQVVRKQAAQVYLCIAIDKEEIFVHFINKNDDGKYVDNTLGWEYEFYDYYLIKEVDSSEYKNIWDLLKSTKKSLVYNHSNKMLRKLCGFDYEII